jgi:CHAT domain-containing protein/tetratricopeptide (TPR) repeat protein
MTFDELLAEIEAVRGRERGRRVRMHRDRFDRSAIQELTSRLNGLLWTDAPRAKQLADLWIEIGSVLRDAQFRTHGLWGRAKARHAMGLYREAAEDYRAVARWFRRAELDLEWAQVQMGHIDALMYLSRYTRALRLAREARKVFTRRREPGFVARLDSNTGNIYHRLDKYRDALRCYDRARRTFEKLGRPYEGALVDFNRANVLTSLGEFDRAMALYRSAREQFRERGQEPRVAQVDYNVAYLYYLTDRYDKATQSYHEVRRRFEQLGDLRHIALSNLDEAEVFLRLNLHSEVTHLCEIARQGFEQLDMRYEAARALANQAIAEIHLGRQEEAAEHLREARRIFTQERNDVWTGVIDLYMATLLRREGKLREALRAARRAYGVFSAAGLVTKKRYARLEMARISYEWGRFGDAAEYGRAALRGAASDETPWLNYQCYHLLGKLSEREGTRAKAGRYLRRAVESVEHMWGEIRADEYKTSFLRDKFRVYEDIVLHYLRNGSERNIRKAFEYVERGKSRALVDLLAHHTEAGARGEETRPSRLVDELHREREKLNLRYTQLNALDTKGERRSLPLVSELREEVALTERKIAGLLRELRQADSELASLHGPSAPPLEAIRDHLDSDEVLIEYYIAHDRVMAFVVDHDRIEVIDYLAEVPVIEDLLSRLQYQLAKFHLGEEYTGRHRSHLYESVLCVLGRLNAELLEPLATRIEGRRLVIVPHGLLHYIPFHAVFDGERFLIDRHELRYAPSANVLRLCGEETVHGAGGEEGLLILGVDGSGAPHINTEVEEISRIFDDSLLFVGARASIDTLRRYGRQGRMIHLACHGIFRSDNPMFSSIKLADGWLNIYDLYDLRLDASLVTLSGCQTGVGKVQRGGDELVGLVRGFLHAGVRSLLVSLWNVHDESAALIMERFYRNLKAGHSRGGALQKAMLETKRERAHPYYWAPFVLVGNG